MNVQRRSKPRTGYLFKRWSGKRLKATSDIVATFYVQLPGCGGVKPQTVCLHTTDYEEALTEWARISGPLKWSPRMQYLRALVDLGQWADRELNIEKGRLNAMRIRDAWDRYQESRRRPKSGPATMISYSHYWQTFTAWTLNKLEYLNQVTPDMADLYARHLDKQPIRAQTVNKHLTLLRLVFRVLVPDYPNPFLGLASNKTAERDTHRALHPDEVRDLLQHAKGEYRGLVLVGYCTGLRLGDCALLDWSAVDLDKNAISLVPSKTKRSGKRVVLPIHPQLMRWLLQTPEKDRSGPVLPAICARYTRNRTYVQKDVANLLDAAGIKKSADGSVGFHSLRHTYDSALKNAGVPASLVMSLLGHKTAAVSAGYFHADHAAASAAIVAALAVVDRPQQGVKARKK